MGLSYQKWFRLAKELSLGPGEIAFFAKLPWRRRFLDGQKVLRLVFCLSFAVLFSMNTPSLSATGGWAATYGGADEDCAYSIQQTSDGGYIVAGWTSSFGAGDEDIWVLKLRPDGTVEWQKAYGGDKGDVARSIQQTSDGGYIVAGTTSSFGTRRLDIWVLKLQPDGTVEWQKTYGGEGWEKAYSIQQTNDGGYVVTGEVSFFGTGDWYLLVLKLRPDGQVEWQRTLGGGYSDKPSCIQQTSDGGYVVAGRTRTFAVRAFDYDFWVLKLGPGGTVEWQKAYGGDNDDWAESIQQTSDGGYIVAGMTTSFNDVGGTWVLKLRADGTIQWQKTYGGGDDCASSIQQTNDGGYIVAGFTVPRGTKKRDLLILRLRANGTVEWQKAYGGDNDDWAELVRQTSDGGYIVAGRTNSFGAGKEDFWVLKLQSDGSINSSYDLARNTRIRMGLSTATVWRTSVKPRDNNPNLQDSQALIQETSVSAKFLVKQ